MTAEWKRDAIGYYKEKDPAENLDYGHDWTNWAEPSDTIVSSAWTSDAGITRTGDGTSGLVTYALFAGGTIGARYFGSNTVTWASGRVVNRSFSIIIKDV